jgi:hypothetical protein
MEVGIQYRHYEIQGTSAQYQFLVLCDTSIFCSQHEYCNLSFLSSPLLITGTKVIAMSFAGFIACYKWQFIKECEDHISGILQLSR